MKNNGVYYSNGTEEVPFSLGKFTKMEEWKAEDAWAWLQLIEDGRFQNKSEFLDAFKEKEMNGENLGELNKTAMKLFGGLDDEDNDLLLKNVERINSRTVKVKRCVICKDRPVSRVVSPCGHFCLCEVCSAVLEARESHPRCPYCRGRIDNCIPYFDVVESIATTAASSVCGD